MARRDSESTVARFEVAQANQEQVLAESALRGEHLVTWVRLVLLLLVTMSQGVIAWLSGELSLVPRDTPRMLTGLLYLGWAISLAVVLHRQKADPHKVRWRPVFATLVDFAFFGFMAWRGSIQSGTFRPHMLAALCAVLIAFSVARYSWLHVVWSTLLAAVTFVTVSVLRNAFWLSEVSFVLGCYVALGLLIAWANTAVSSMFLGLRRRDNLSRFLPRQVVERVLRTGDGTL